MKTQSPSSHWYNTASLALEAVQNPLISRYSENDQVFQLSRNVAVSQVFSIRVFHSKLDVTNAWLHAEI